MNSLIGPTFLECLLVVKYCSWHRGKKRSNDHCLQEAPGLAYKDPEQTPGETEGLSLVWRGQYDLAKEKRQWSWVLKGK